MRNIKLRQKIGTSATFLYILVQVSVGTKNISTHLGSLIKNAHKEGQEDPGTMVLYPMDFITQ